jgi:hypothetical protein
MGRDRELVGTKNKKMRAGKSKTGQTKFMKIKEELKK